MRCLAFTDRGFALAVRLADQLHGTADRCGQPLGLDAWTREAFSEEDALIFVGAAGIAVRAIAPYVRSKTSDPAVVVVDENGAFAIPILSGHLGGANDLARRISALCGAVPVITTATDGRGVFAVDEWAKRQRCAIGNPAAIKRLSAALLAGERVGVCSDYPISGPLPEGLFWAEEGSCDLRLSLYAREGSALHVVPRIAVLGVGCKKGTSAEQLESVFVRLLDLTGIVPSAICRVATLDRKADEPGLTAFCRRHGWEMSAYSAEALRVVEGTFSASPFVERTVGVDNVCERAAVLDSGGDLMQTKFALEGVTMALACMPYAPDWRWQDEDCLSGGPGPR
ncbi:MAG: cobalt-precorrin 5A hydrolase [Oscillospiraceae bacterium]|nr:cobalt-precorrin 5A hydrolase [Oscillospiraceae bacterium]